MGRIKAGIIVFLGTNCEKDTKLACDYMGWESEYIFQDEKIKSGYDIIFLPGGFSYGDYVSSGRLAKLTPAVKSLPIGKTLITGICNGFQILCEAEILPGALTHNSSMKFISKNVDLEFNNRIIKLPIAHHQGNYMQTGSVDVFMKYTEDINGSDSNIASIIDNKNKIIGMMPHPERVISKDGQIVFKALEKLI